MKPVPPALAAPWAIEPYWLRVVFGVWSRGQLDMTALESARADWQKSKGARAELEEDGLPVEGTGNTLRIIGDVGVVSVTGPLFRHANLFCDFSGGTSYDALHRALDAIEMSPRIARVMFRFSTPGGEADGCNELANRLAGLKKPARAHVDGMCASAGIWLASQIGTIEAEETAELGSIGVRVGVVDHSAADEMAGVREIEIISSQSPGKRSTPIDDAVVARIQTRIDDLADIFVAAVARGRGVDAAKVIEDFGGGDVMIAHKALSAGLIDGIATFNDALAAFAAAPAGGRTARHHHKERIIMANPISPTAGDAPEWQCAGCNEMMGPSAKSFCAKCAEDDEDDTDEEDAKALGLELKASTGARRIRMASLVDFERRVLETTGGDQKQALERITEGATARTEIAKVRADGLKLELRSTLERGLQGTAGQQGRLSLGAIQKSMQSVLRGPAKKAWVAAMDKLAADADEAKSSVTAGQVMDAACSVALAAEDIEAIGEFVATQPPLAASTFIEPARRGKEEDAELDATAMEVKKAADNARAIHKRGLAASTK